MYKLFIDESGKNNLKNIQGASPFFCVAGTLIHDNATDFAKTRSEQIKFKYWGDPRVNFHAHDLRHLKGDFAIFKRNKDKLNEFYVDFKDFLSRTNYKILFVCINKAIYIAKNPPVSDAIINGYDKDVRTFEIGLNKKLFDELWQIYMCYLSTKNKANGTIIVEASDKTQDIDILSAYNKIMSNGIPSMNLSNIDIRNVLTAISFVTKNNLDIETQIADFASHYLNLDERVAAKLKEPHTKHEQDIVKIFRLKTFTARCKGSNFNSCVTL